MPLIVMQSLQKYFDLAKRTGNLNELGEFDDIIEEYELFSKRVRDIALQYVHIPKVHLYRKRFTLSADRGAV